ncbi:PDZ and LIM domain protein Zasp-like [Pollicipes pollicipes]|uniref:PDZ and LIM domain protein Zasp-like n=1 Tax=Pollicipes pollicipes TaxID=41117 RepID=UPI001885492D|nr:PDZ and LIM domain protein Zasp-like [Pollicipes pollicipes]
MRHKEAQDSIVRSGNNICMVVQRGGLASLRLPPSATSVPKDAPDAAAAPQQQQQQQVQQQAQPAEHPHPPAQPRQRNPFRVIKNLETTDGSVKALVHNQFNSPMPLYSEEKIAETLSAQTEVLAGGALGVDFRKNEKKYDGNMSEVLRMVQDMDNSPEAYVEPEEAVDAASLPPEYSGLNSIKSRTMRSLVVKPDSNSAPQTSVHAPRITAPSATKVAPPVAPKPAPQMAPRPAPQVAPRPAPAAPGSRGPPGMRSTTATMIRTDPATGSVKLVSAVDTETKHFNAFNRTPQSFKPASGAPSYQPAPAAPSYQPAPAAPSYQPAPVAPSHQAPPAAAQQQQSFSSGTSGISQVDYSSYVPQRKGGTTFAWPPQPTEVDSAPAPFAGGHVEVSRPAPAPAPAPAPKPAPPPVLPKPAPPASFAPPPAPAPPKQVSFGQPSFAPAVAPKPAPPAPSSGGPTKLGFNGGLPGLGGLGGGPGGGPGGGRGSMAGRTNAPRRGRGQLNPAATGSRIPHCATCANQIRGPFITALGQCWCPGCFVCATPQCRQSLENIGFVEVEGQTHCENCWERHLAPVCNKCQRRIKEDCLKAIGKAYHPECFACAYCGGLFGNSAFFLEDGLPYCENDWNELFTTKCVGCGFPIEAGDRWVEALNKNFHSQCFKCAVCRTILDGMQFYAKAGRAVCKVHAGKF